jgi:ferric-dicitrate binding protein FerR (iron transport regulator)
MGAGALSGVQYLNGLVSCQLALSAMSVQGRLLLRDIKAFATLLRPVYL